MDCYFECVKKFKLVLSLCCFMLFSPLVAVAEIISLESDNKNNYGLYVDENGVLKRDGKPYQGIGVNYFDSFYRLLRNNNRAYKNGLRELSKHNIPFIRFMAGGFWPVDYELYLHNREEYFRLLDVFIRDAEEYDIGLIPCLFWNYATISDVVGEPVSEWGNPGSKTRKFMRNFTFEFVRRFREYRSIWGWEFANEMSLYVDLPNAEQFRPIVAPHYGTPKSRTKFDDLSSTILVNVLKEFSEVVRSLDKNRIIISGNSIPRPYAFHNSVYGSWKNDSRKEFGLVLSRDNPDSINTISIHIYPNVESKYFLDGKTKIVDLLREAMNVAALENKPLFIGEFGVSKSHSRDIEERKFSSLVFAIEELRVPLSALWVFDYTQQEGEYNVTFSNDRFYQLKKISEANRRLSIN